MAPKKGAMKSKKTSPKKMGTVARRDEEWVPSRIGEAELGRLVEAGVLLDRATAGWRPALGESFPTPHTDEAVVFEDYLWHGLGFPIHPFLRDLLELWGLLCVISTPIPFCTSQSSSTFVRHTSESYPTSIFFVTYYG